MVGIIPIFKPTGCTSYDVIRQIKKKSEEKKIGHGGTLDPFAEGVLVVAIGREATKKLAIILNHTLKTYEATIVLGATSTTDDPEGEIRQLVDIGGRSSLSIETVEICVKDFVGEILQTPPVYSAVKIQGIPAYKRTRLGEKLVLEPKKVFVKEIKILEYSYPELKIELTCGSGFYVRALARDLGEKLGVGGYLKTLKRTRIWNPKNPEIDFKLENCVQLEDV
jgi:tRNA pseudouridine55 synthase